MIAGGSGRGASPLLAEGLAGVGGRLVVSLLAGPGGVGCLWCRGSSSPILASVVAGVAPGVVEGGGVMVDDADAASGWRCCCEADVGAPGDVDGEGAAGGAQVVGAAGDANGENAAGDALVDGAAPDALTVP